MNVTKMPEGSRVKTTVYWNSLLLRQVKEKAAQTNTSASDLVRFSCQYVLDNFETLKEQYRLSTQY